MTEGDAAKLKIGARGCSRSFHPLAMLALVRMTKTALALARLVRGLPDFPESLLLRFCEQYQLPRDDKRAGEAKWAESREKSQ